MAPRTEILARERALERRRREALARRQETIFAVALGLTGLALMLLTLMNFSTLKFAFEESDGERPQAVELARE